MGMNFEGVTVNNAERLEVRKAIGALGSKWIDLVAVGHDGKELHIASVFDTHLVVTKEPDEKG